MSTQLMVAPVLVQVLCLLLAVAVAVVAAGGENVPFYTPTPPLPPTPGYPQCNICGRHDKRVTQKHTMVHVLGQDPVSCIELQQAGDNGFIDQRSCGFMKRFVRICQCKAATRAPTATATTTTTTTATTTAILSTRTPTLSPLLSSPNTPKSPAAGVTTPILVAAPSPPIPPPTPEYVSCDICGGGGGGGNDDGDHVDDDHSRVVTNPDVMITIDQDHEPVSCADFYQAGQSGFIDESFCAHSQELALPCGCAPASVPTMPSETPSVMSKENADATEELDTSESQQQQQQEEEDGGGGDEDDPESSQRRAIRH